VIKYLSVLSSEGEVEFVEVGPAKLWMTKDVCPMPHGDGSRSYDVEALPIVDIDCCAGEDKTVYFSFCVDPEKICALLKRTKKCLCNAADTC
jgi:hypothetical protein